MWFTRSVAALAGFSLILAFGLPQAAATTPGQCKVVSQDEVVSKGELMKEALGLIGTGALLILSIRKGAPRIALAAEGALALKDVAGIAPHLSHAVQLQRLRYYFGLSESDKLEICPAGNQLAAELGFRNLAMIGPAAGDKNRPSLPNPSLLTKPGSLGPSTVTTFDPFKRDIAEALKTLNKSDAGLVAPRPLASQYDLNLPKLSQRGVLRDLEQKGVVKTYKPLQLDNAKSLSLFLSATLRGVILDKQAKGVNGASVQLVNEKTKVSTLVKADAGGRYVADHLSAGDYSVNASAAGLIGQQKFVQLKVASTADVNFVLTPRAPEDCDYKVVNATRWTIIVGQADGPFSVRIGPNESTVFAKLRQATRLSGKTSPKDPVHTWSFAVSCERPSSRLVPPG